MNNKITVQGREMTAVDSSKSKWGQRWNCLVCGAGYGTKQLPAYSSSAAACLCRKCADRRVGPSVVAPVVATRPYNQSNPNSQSGGSITDILEDCY